MLQLKEYLTLHCGSYGYFSNTGHILINKFCSPSVNQYSPFPTIEVRRNKMVQWMEIKCVTLRSARSYPPCPLPLLLLAFSHQNRSATNARQPPSRREKYQERERRQGEKKEKETRNSWSDEKKRANSLLCYHKLNRLYFFLPNGFASGKVAFLHSFWEKKMSRGVKESKDPFGGWM